MRVEVANNIRIKDIRPGVYKSLKNELTFDNPEYLKKQRLGKWLGGTPEKLRLYETNGCDVIVPFGMLRTVYSLRQDGDKFIPLFQKPEKIINYGSKIKLYTYQQPAVEKAIASKNGVIIAPCGAGKTQIGLEIIERIGQKTLWLTHTEDLLRQSMERAKSVFSLPDKAYGTITGGKVDVGSAITFATVQTMAKLDLPLYKNEWSVIVVDEAHHIAGTPTKIMMFYKVISNLSARYKFGLTATPERTDGLQGCMFALLGEKIHEIDKAEVAGNTCPVSVRVSPTGYMPDFDSILASDGTISFPQLVGDIIHSEARNRYIIRQIKAAEGSCLILTDRIEHINILAERLREEGVPFEKLLSISTKAGKAARKQAISDLKDGKIKCLIATYALAKEGLDVPSLRNVFFTTPQKNKITVVQSAGRVARKFEGKEYGCVYDYVDDFSMLENWASIRRGYFRKLGYNIVYDM